MIFSKFIKSKKISGKLYAAVSGTALPITEVNDEVFSNCIIGEGVAIKPESNRVVSPVNGIISYIADSYHGYGITVDDGTEVLLHIGIDTVELNGKGFQCMVSVGQKVSVGTVICEVDFDYLSSEGYATDVITIIVNGDKSKYHVIPSEEKEVIAGRTCTGEYIS